MRCQCNVAGTDHTINNCMQRAYYHVTRDTYDADGKFIERIELSVCPECKFPDDFHVTKIENREPFQMELGV